MNIERDSQWDCPDMSQLCAFDERVRRICPKTCQNELKDTKVFKYFGDPCQEQKEFYEFQWTKPPEGSFIFVKIKIN